MKELSIEEKANRYDEAIERAKKWYDANTNEGYRGIFEDIFPELKESKDERIRKWLIYYFKEVCDNVSEKEKKSVLDWLEKQGKNNMGISEDTKQKLEDNLNKALEKETPESWNEFIEKQDKQKPIAKYKVSDTIYYNSFGRLVSFVIANIVEDGTDNPMYEDKDGNSVFQNDIVEQKPICSEEQREKKSLSEIENRIINFAMQFHDNRMKPEAEWEDELKMLRDNIKIDPWSEEDWNCLSTIIAEFSKCAGKSVSKDEWMRCNDFLNSLRDRVRLQIKQEWNEEDEYILSHIINDLKFLKNTISIDPNYIVNITDIEREINWFKSFKDKVQPQIKQEWSERDELMLEASISFIKSSSYPYFGDTLRGEISKIEAEDWIKHLKNRVQPQQEWSEEDDIYIENIILAVEEQYHIAAKELTSWLKSLKERYTWKPSEEQMDALYTYIYNPQYFNSPDPRMELVESVYQDLKRLREE